MKAFLTIVFSTIGFGIIGGLLYLTVYLARLYPDAATIAALIFGLAVLAAIVVFFAWAFARAFTER